ncbi:MAG: hypothetical protein K0R49_1305, partial [Burkholderiales bacterium]|nr:hypothetical protein [Burkholderiales bacterium]
MDNWENYITMRNAKLPVFRPRLSKIRGDARYFVTETQ